MTAAPSVRAFFAVPVPDALRAELARTIDALRARSWGERVRWVPAENLHLTLRFLGDVESEHVPALLASVRAGVSGALPCRCRAEGVHGFPSAARARVVAASVAPEEPLVRLHERIESAVVAQGVAPETRRFRAHLTLGRARRPPLRGADLDAPLADAWLPVDRVVLYRSDLGRDGARYTPLGEAPLDGTSGA